MGEEVLFLGWEGWDGEEGFFIFYFFRERGGWDGEEDLFLWDGWEVGCGKRFFFLGGRGGGRGVGKSGLFCRQGEGGDGEERVVMEKRGFFPPFREGVGAK